MKMTGKMNMKMKNGISAKSILACAIMAIAALVGFTGCPGDDIKALQLSGIDLSNVADGQYEGIQDTSLVKVTVLVTVADRAITDIKITRHDCGKGKPAEAIVGAVIAKQTTKVDTVSGATGSSVVILKAIENALGSSNGAK